MHHPFPTGTRIAFDIEDLVLGTAIVVGAKYEEGWLYLLAAVETTRGDTDTLRRLTTECDGGVWVCEHEVHAQPSQLGNDGGAA